MNGKDTGVSDQSTAEIVVRAVPTYYELEKAFLRLKALEPRAMWILRVLPDEAVRFLLEPHPPSLPPAILPDLP